LLSSIDVNRWLSKHRLLHDNLLESKGQIEFITKLFYSWDDDGSGILELDEIAGPLIALGLAPDREFVGQLIRSIDQKFLKKNDDQLSITINDFLKIFKKQNLGNFDLKQALNEKEQTKKAKTERYISANLDLGQENIKGGIKLREI
jgi:Ca2+-binding EF-hand superfamily protein